MNMEGSFALIAGGMILLFVIAVIIMAYFAQKYGKRRKEELKGILQDATQYFQEVLNDPKSTKEEKERAQLAVMNARLSLARTESLERADFHGGHGHGFGGGPFGYGGGVGIGIHADI